jgi:hypothetical protein
VVVVVIGVLWMGGYGWCAVLVSMGTYVRGFFELFPFICVFILSFFLSVPGSS